MKSCKGFCKRHSKDFEFCCDEEGNTIKVQFGKTPGRNTKPNKNCNICGYWLTTKDSKCFCCNSLYHLRRNYDWLTVLYDFLVEYYQELAKQQTTLNNYFMVQEIRT